MNNLEDSMGIISLQPRALLEVRVLRLVQQIGGPGALAASVDGLTGVLELNLSDGRVRRSLQFARIEGGKPQAASTGVATFREIPATNLTGAPPPN